MGMSKNRNWRWFKGVVEELVISIATFFVHAK